VRRRTPANTVEAPELETDDFYCELVLSGHLAVDVLAETARVLAFRHTRPVAPFHAVLIPRFHVRTLLELDDMGVVAEVFAMARELVQRFELEATAFRIVTNGGAYQESKHLHFHLLSPLDEER
jgi:histidine triad (HIT) family protein